MNAASKLGSMLCTTKCTVHIETKERSHRIDFAVITTTFSQFHFIDYLFAVKRQREGVKSAGGLFSTDKCLLTESLSFLASFFKEHCDNCSQ